MLVAKLRPRTPDELHSYIKLFYGYDLSRKAVCPGHCSPFDVAWSMWTDEGGDEIIIGPRGGGKCWKADERLTLADGQEVEAKTLIGRRFSLPSLTWADRVVGMRDRRGDSYSLRHRRYHYCLSPQFAEGPNVIENVSAVAFDNGEQPCVMVETGCGATRAVTANHLLLTPRGWVEAAELRPGDFIAVATRTSAAGRTPLDEDIVLFLAYMFAEGATQYDQYRFSQMPGPQRDEFEAVCCRLGIGLRAVKCGCCIGLRSATKQRMQRGIITSIPGRILQQHGLRDKHSRDKRVPRQLFEAPNRQVAAFLSRVFGCDGSASVYKGAGGKIKPSVELTLISREGIADIKRLMLRLGVLARMTTKRTQKSTAGGLAWRLSVTGARNVLRFATNVGMYGKEDALGVAVAVAEACVASGRAKNHAHPDFTWSTVASVSEIGRHPTVGIEVPDHHTVVSELIEHNTIGMAMGAHMKLFHDAEQIINIGAVKDQVAKFYRYVTGFARLKHFRWSLAGPPLKESMELLNGGRIEIVPATMERVNGPHVPKVNWDEVELIEQRILDEGEGIPIRSASGSPPVVRYTSSMKFAHGTMVELLKKAGKPDSGLTVRRYCIFEVIEKCPPERHREGVGCETCPLKPDCKMSVRHPDGRVELLPGPGRAAQAEGWMKIDDVIKKKKKVTPDVWNAQYLSKRPQTSGLVYPDFSPEIHVVDYEWNRVLPVFSAIDFGYANPSVALYAQVTAEDEVIVFDEDWRQYRTTPELGGDIENAPYFSTTLWRVGDPAAADARATLQRMGIPIEAADNRKTARNDDTSMIGLDLVRWLLKPPDRPTPLLFISRRCVNTLLEIESYHYPDPQSGRNLKEEPQEHGDHCFVAGTMIATPDGDRPIETIMPGELVWTRDGPREVLASGRTGIQRSVVRLEASDGIAIRGTANHRIYTERGLLRTDALRYNDTLWTLPSRSGLESTHTGVTPIQRAVPTGSTIGQPPADFYTAPFGRLCMAAFREVITSIIGTATRLTTRSTISSACPQSSIANYTPRPCPTNAEPTFASTLTASGTWPGHGTLHPPEGASMAASAARRGSTANPESTAVIVAAKLSKASKSGVCASAQTPAGPLLAEIQGPTISSGSAAAAEFDSRSRATAPLALVPAHVLGVYVDGRADVYNLLVEGTHEFFANGVLVSNCMDALRYLVMRLYRGRLAV